MGHSSGNHHESVNHTAEERVRGDVYTNGVENAWSLFKRSVVGSFHHVSEKHIDRYLDEVQRPEQPVPLQGHADEAAQLRADGVQGTGGEEVNPFPCACHMV
ncbi:MAG: transposase [Syntrophorhabdales bacterium]